MGKGGERFGEVFDICHSFSLNQAIPDFTRLDGTLRKKRELFGRRLIFRPAGATHTSRAYPKTGGIYAKVFWSFTEWGCTLVQACRDGPPGMRGLPPGLCGPLVSRDRAFAAYPYHRIAPSFLYNPQGAYTDTSVREEVSHHPYGGVDPATKLARSA